MRKFTLLIASLFITIGAMAQSYIVGEPVANVKTGYYVVMATSNINNAATPSTGPVYYAGSYTEKYLMDQDKTINTNDLLTDGNYIWYVEKSGSTITLKNVQDNVYFVKDAAKNNNFGGTETASLILEEVSSDAANTFFLHLEDTSIGYIHCNYRSQDPCLSYWNSNGVPGSCVRFQFYEVAPSVERTDWIVTASSEETDGEGTTNGRVGCIIDGDEDTFWHSQYSTEPAATYPHWIEFDMKSKYSVSHFNYVSRFDNTTSNGQILDYKLYISDEPMSGTYTNATSAASGTFVYGNGTHHLIELATPVTGRYIALVAESGTAGSWSGNAAATAANCSEFYVYGTLHDNTAEKEALRSLIEQVEAWDAADIIGDGVGQRSSTNPNAATEFNAIVEYYKGITDDTESSEIEGQTAELQAIIDSYTVINMPVNGKAYTFKNVQADGTSVCWFKYDGSQLTLTTVETEATVFVCRVLANGKYAFAINAGKYITWRGNDAANSNKSGVKDAYDTSDEAWTDLTIQKMTTATDHDGAYDSDVDMTDTRYMIISGRRQPETAEKDKFAYFVVKENDGTPRFDHAGVPYYKVSHGNPADSYSSAFIIEDAKYANTPALHAVGTSSLLTDELYNTTMATFSAPFATVVPENVTAYYATAGDGFVTLKAIDSELAIPANIGVILVGANESITEAVMAPAAGETEATVTGNVLVGTAGAEQDLALDAGYILGLFNGEAGFYKNNAGTLAMNKAYIALSGTNQSVEVRFPGTTGIDEVKTENGNVKTVYDLQGRIVENPTAGIYIVNGKKVLVK